MRRRRLSGFKIKLAKMKKLFLFNSVTSFFSSSSPKKKLDDFRLEIQRRDQEIMSMAAKMKTLEEQHQVANVWQPINQVN
jgi:hypothetical protein